MSSASLSSTSKQRRRGSLSESAAHQPKRTHPGFGVATTLAFGGLTLSSLPQVRRASRERLASTSSLASRGSEKALAQLAAAKLPGTDSDAGEKHQDMIGSSHKAPMTKLVPPKRVYARQISAPAGSSMANTHNFSTLAPPPVLRPASSYRQLRDYFIQRQKYVVGHMHLMPTAPDGGWGWVVVVAAFVTTAIVEGIAFSFAPILIHLTTEAPHMMLPILFMGATLISTYLLVCPLAMSLVNAFDCRRVLFAGSFISTVGFLIPYYVYAFSSGAPPPPENQLLPNFANMSGSHLTQPVEYSFLIISYGIIAGIGFGLMYMSALVAVSQYFELNRALAMGIALCGSGAGTLILPPILSVLLDGRGFDGAVTVLAGLTANGAAAALLLRKLKPQTAPRRRPRSKNALDRVRELQRDVAGGTKRSDSEQSIAPETNEEAFAICRELRLRQLATESGLNSMSPSRGELASLAGTVSSGGGGTTSDPIKSRAPSAPPAVTVGEDDMSSTPPLILVNHVSDAGLSSVTFPTVTDADEATIPLTASETVSGFNEEDPGEPDPQDSITRLKAQLAVVLPPPSITAVAKSVRHSNSAISSRSERTSSAASPSWLSSSNMAHDSKNKRVRQQQSMNNRRFLVAQAAPLTGVSGSSRRPSGSFRGGNTVVYQTSGLSSAKQRLGGVSVSDFSRPLYRVDILYGRSITHLPRCQSEANIEEYRAGAFKIPVDNRKTESSGGTSNNTGGGGGGSRPSNASWTAGNGPFEDENNKSRKKSKNSCRGALEACNRALLRVVPKPLLDTLKSIINPGLFRDSAFIRMALGSALCMMAVPLPYFVLPWRALVLRPQRLDEDPTSPLLASCLISIIGGASMAGRLVSGFVADLPNMNLLLLHNMALLVTTVATFMAHMANQYAALCVYAGIFGFCFAFHMSLFSVVLGEAVGVERLTSAFGLVTIFRGLAPLCTIPLLAELLGPAKYCVSELASAPCPPLPASSMPRAPNSPDALWFARVPPPPAELETINNLSDVGNMANGYRRVLWLSGSLLFVASALFSSLHLKPGTGSNNSSSKPNSSNTGSRQTAGGASSRTGEASSSSTTNHQDNNNSSNNNNNKPAHQYNNNNSSTSSSNRTATTIVGPSYGNASRQSTATATTVNETAN